MTHQDIFQYFVPLEILLVTLSFLQLLGILPEVLHITTKHENTIWSHKRPQLWDSRSFNLALKEGACFSTFLLQVYCLVLCFIFLSFFKCCDVNRKAYYLVVAVCCMIMKQDLVHPLKSFILSSFTGVPRRGDRAGCGGFSYKPFLGQVENFLVLALKAVTLSSPCPIINVKFLY